MHLRIGVLAIVLAFGLGQGGSALATPEKVPLYPLGVRTGRARIDAVLKAVQERNIDLLTAKVKFQMVPCVEEFQPGVHPHPPYCLKGEPDGTPVAVIRGSAGLQCNTTWLREADVRVYLDAFRNETAGVYSVFRATTDKAGVRGLYDLLYGFPHEGGHIGGSIFLDAKGKIVIIYLRTCRTSPRDVLAFSPGVLVLGPRERR